MLCYAFRRYRAVVDCGVLASCACCLRLTISMYNPLVAARITANGMIGNRSPRPPGRWVLSLGGVCGEEGLGASAEYRRRAVLLAMAEILHTAWLLARTVCICDKKQKRSQQLRWLLSDLSCHVKRSARGLVLRDDADAQFEDYGQSRLPGNVV